MAQTLHNNVFTKLAASLSNSATSISLLDGSDFPTPAVGDFYFATLVSISASTGKEDDWEIVKVTGKPATNTLTVTRGQEGTAARAWDTYTPCEIRITAGTVIMPDGTQNLSNKTITSSTLDSTVVGGTTAAAGSFTDLDATTVEATNVEVTNIKAKDGTAAGSIADSTGVVTLDSAVLTTADINGGTVDGATIGQTTAALGTFTDMVADELQLTGGSGDQGTLSWNADEDTVALVVSSGESLQLGQEVEYNVRNNSGSSIAKGVPVMITGTIGSSGRITIGEMDATSVANDKKYLGITAEAIASGADGKVMYFGKVSGLNTSSYSAGDLLFLDTSVVGGLTATEPSSGIKLGAAYVVHSHASAGVLMVRPSASVGLHDLHDVFVDAPGTGEIIRYNASNGLWETKTLAEAGIATTTNFTSTGIDDNASSTAITISSAGETTFGGDVILSEATPAIEWLDSDVADSQVRFVSTGSIFYQRIRGGTSSYGEFRWQRTDDGSTYLDTLRIPSSGDLIFHDSTGAQAFRWDASTSRVGIGEQNPLASLHVNEGDVGAFTTLGRQIATFERSGAAFINLIAGTVSSTGIDFGDVNDVDAGSIRFDNADDSFAFRIADDEKVRISSSGNVGIGGSPDAPLTVFGGGVAEFRVGNFGPSSNSAIRISRNDPTIINGNPLGYLEFGSNDATASADTAFAYVSAEAEGTFGAGDNPTALTFGVTADGTGSPFEAMRIDNSGNVGIGETNPSDGKLQIAATAEAGVFVRDASVSNAAPYIRVQGQRQDANGSESFSGGLVLEHYRTDAAIVNNKALGTIYFGGNHTDGSESNIAYGASIVGKAEGTFNSASDMPTGLAFFTGVTGRALGTPNVDFGGERMRISSAGYVGIGEQAPSSLLHLKENTGDLLTLEADSATIGPNIVFANSGGNLARIASAETDVLRFEVGPSNDEAMRISSNGTVTIGTPAQTTHELSVREGASPRISIDDTNGTSTNVNAGLLLRYDTTNAASFSFTNNADLAVTNNLAGDIIYETGAEHSFTVGGTEELRITNTETSVYGTSGDIFQLIDTNLTASGSNIGNVRIAWDDSAGTRVAYVGTANSSDFFVNNQYGSTKLTYAGSTKITTISAGINVTGSIGVNTTPSNLLHIKSSGADFATMRLDASSNTTPATFQLRAHDGVFDIRDLENSATRLEIKAGGDVELTTQYADLYFNGESGQAGISTTSGAAGGFLVRNIYGSSGVNFKNSGDVEIYSSSGSSIVGSVAIDTSGNVRIGNRTPASMAGGTSTNPILSIGGNDTSLNTTGDRVGSVAFLSSDASYTNTFGDGVAGEVACITDTSTGGGNALTFYTGNTGLGRGERMRITSAGYVGIGEDVPARHLHVNSGSTQVTSIFESTGASSYIDFANSTTAQSRSRIGAEGTDTLVFKTEGAERLRIRSGGNVLITNGDLEIASGHGIDFSATGQASGMSNELLDDYEEGTWTPSANYGTLNFTDCTYTKIGRLVHVSGALSSLSDYTTTQDILISGLPFQSASTSTALGATMYRDVSLSTMNDLSAYVASNGTVVRFYSSRNDGAGWVVLQYNHLDSGLGDIYFTVTYHV